METRVPRVLVVDDEPSNRKLLVDLVVREGLEARSAAGGAEALTVLADESIDLVLLDLMMPGVDGMAVLVELQKRGVLPGLPVVVVTAHDDRKIRVDALTAGAIDFITKPIDQFELACRIRTHLELKRLRDRAVAAAEDRLRESDHLLRLHFEQSPVAKIVWDDEFRVVTWNPAAEVLFGYSRAEALGKHASFLFAELPESLLAEARRDFHNGRRRAATGEALRKDGKRVLCEWYTAPLTRADGELVGASTIALDVTERERLQNTLAHSQRMESLGRLAGGVAHDFNNVLAVILSYGGFVLDALSPGDERREDMLEVLKATERGAGLTSQLLAFSRNQPAEKRPTDLNHRLGHVHKFLVRTLGEDVALTIVPSARPAVVRIDPVQFDQIALNFAINARDAMPDGGRLRVAVEHPPEPLVAPDEYRWVHLKFTDTGIGMDEQTQQRIFEPFFTTKERGKGTGLGLATCFGIVDDAGGRIRVRSAPGQGTTFTVELPLCGEAAVTEVEPVRPVPRASRGEVVLVAEDDVALRKVAERVLTNAGYRVHVAADGPEAIRKLDVLGPRLDVLITDVVMPGCSGYDVAAHASRAAPAAEILLTSGFLDVPDRVKAQSRLPILWKPTPPQALVRAVAEALQVRANRTVSVTPEVAAGRTVLLVEDDDAAGQAVLRVLKRAGYVSQRVATMADARRRLELEPEPDLVLCDLSLPDGSGAELLGWLQFTRPTLCPRVFVLTGGATDEPGHRVLTSGLFRVLEKPIHPSHLLEALASVEGALARQPSMTPSPTTEDPLPAIGSNPASAGNASNVRRDRVLIVDDDTALAEATARGLGDEFEVVVAGTKAAAREVLAESAFDALVLDVELPDGSGLDLLRDLRGRHAWLPVVMTTAHPVAESAPLALGNRVGEYLPKPFLPRELGRVVRAVADSGRIARLRARLLAARFGGDEFSKDIANTERHFALALPRIRMAFQPIVRAADGSVFGYEALLRSDEPSFGTPLRLLAAAEVLGRVDEVGRAVRAAVAGVMQGVRHRVEAIFVNLHPAEVRADLLGESTDPLLAVANQVVLEIKERAPFDAGPKLDYELECIRALGYRVAVDELGDGCSGLSSLVRLRPDVAKIDMSLVRDIDRSALKKEIVTSLLEVARRAGVIVVAEGIETKDECDTLIELGCDLLQGFHFAEPGPPFPVPRVGAGRPEAAGGTT